MYSTGTIIDFEQRLHQQPANEADIFQFIIEGQGYLASLLRVTSDKWEKEVRKKHYQVTVNGGALVLPLLSGTLAAPAVAATFTQTASGQPLIASWVLPYKGLGVSGVNVYTCFNTGTPCTNVTLASGIAGAPTTFSQPYSGNGFYSLVVGVKGDSYSYLTGVVTGQLVSGYVVSGSLI